MKASRLKGMAVVSIEDAEKVGSVHDILVHPDGHRIVALQVKMVHGGETTIVPVDEVASIGRDAITIHDSRGIATEIAAEEGTVHLSKLMGTKVLTHSGDLLGTVAEVEMEPSSFSIIGYDLSTGAVSDLIGNRKRLESQEGVHYGRNILMVRDAGDNQPHGRDELGGRERPDLRVRTVDDTAAMPDDARYTAEEEAYTESERRVR